MAAFGAGPLKLMTERQSLVAANWKMNGTLSTVQPLLRAVINGLDMSDETEIAICPPFVYLAELSRQLDSTGILLGAQNVSQFDAGAHTGEISAGMLRDYRCRLVIVGHSERRALYGENDEVVAAKFIRVVENGLIPILCVGETLDERENGDTEVVIAQQLDTVIEQAGVELFDRVVIAYEPVWAIGTGRTATPEQAQDVHAFIRLRLARHDDAIADGLRILYGGSVKPGNAGELFNMADIDGGLIGGASLVAEDFLTICQAAKTGNF